MDRRELLKGAGALALAAMAGSAAAANKHEHHQHGGGATNAKIIETAGVCIEKGQVCLAHCLTLLGDGDKEMAGCAKSVNQMLAICGALQQLAAQQSKHLAATAKIAAKACKECEVECKKHADMHEVCKDCMEACAACRKECEALAV